MLLAHESEAIRSNRKDRDTQIAARNVNIDGFLAHMKEAEIGNECDTDEYRETQPSKGLLMLADFFEDTYTTKEAYQSMMRRMIAWMTAVVDKPDESYAGAAELKDCLDLLWDFRAELGYYSLYQPTVTTFDYLDNDVDYFKEETS
jgi:hypothetical protein